MIYNNELTEKLKEFYGNDVLTWPKSNIRWLLEEGVKSAERLILDPSYKAILNSTYSIYQEFKEVDNEFTEHYTNELN